AEIYSFGQLPTLGLSARQSLYVQKLLLLPLCMDFDFSYLPLVKNYLHSDTNKQANIRALHATNDHRVRVGLMCYAAKHEEAVHHVWARAMPDTVLAQLAKIDVQWVLIEPQCDAKMRRHAADIMGAFDASDHIDDFDDLAAWQSHCDLLIALEGGAVHLAGALGVECWTILRHPYCWRWPKQGDATRWYPSVRQFTHEGGWDKLAAELTIALQDRYGYA
ncbi:MAG: hypothetical protein AAF352_01685, partial [Pseudomonadota bacterium]